jgi:Lar family restriction alleviation protein
MSAETGSGTLEALPCPFCGSVNLDTSFFMPGCDSFQVACGDCGATGPEKETETEALLAWNNRHRSQMSNQPLTVATVTMVPGCVAYAKDG